MHERPNLLLALRGNHWKYNAVGHIIANHPGLDTNNLDKQFVVDIQIQEQEEQWMKVSSELTNKYRNKHNDLFLSGEELSVVKREDEQECEQPKKRSRGTVDTPTNKRRRR